MDLNLDAPHSMGTTIISVTYNGGVVLGADSRTSTGFIRIQLGQPATVKVSANLIRMLTYNNKNMIQTGLIVGGWDKYEG
ncbi:unnamed protein product [Cochlearia groenlandica]